jgi:hypothetical protein
MQDRNDGFTLALALTRDAPRRAEDFGRRVDAAMVAELMTRLPAPPRHVFRSSTSLRQWRASGLCSSLPNRQYQGQDAGNGTPQSASPVVAVVVSVRRLTLLLSAAARLQLFGSALLP